MAYENLCMYCFKDLNGRNVCPHCGKDARAAVPQIQLLPGTLVYRDRFLIGRALGQDASGIVYTAMDTKRGGTIRIREYLPRNCAERLNDGGVVPIAGMEDSFENGMNKLRASVESVEDPKKRHFFFEENGTAYIAQRKASAAAPAAYTDDEEDEEYEGGRGRLFIYIGIVAAVVLIIALGLIWFLTSMSDPEDVTLNQPISTVAPEATWMPAETPTPTPYVAPTFAPLVDPELSWMDYTYGGDVNDDYEEQVNATTTKIPTILDEDNDSGNYSTISGNSSKAEIKKLQQILVQLGWLDYTNINGKYDSATKQAVKDFQKYVNDYCNPKKKLTVDGIAGKNTLKWLMDSSVNITKPTPTPTPLVTPNPDEIRVDQNSSKVDIMAVQNKLIALGLMKEGSADGVYGDATIKAVKNFQKRVNQLQGYQALKVTGIVNEETMAYLNYYVAWWESQQQATATPKPTVTPTPKPGSQIINSDSTKEEITAVQEMLEKVGLLKGDQVDGRYGKNTINAVKAFQAWVNEVKGVETLATSGEVDPLTMAYLKYAVEHDMKVQAATATPEPEIELPTAEPDVEEDESSNLFVDPSSEKESIAFVQEMLYSMGLLGQNDIDGDYGEKTAAAVALFQQHVNAHLGEGTLDINGWKCDASTLGYMEYYYESGITVKPTAEPTSEPTEEPTEAPTEEPTAEPTAEPTEEPTEEPTQAPIEPEVIGFTVSINGGEAVDGIVQLEKGKYIISWAAESGAESYSVYLYNGSGKLINKSENTTSTQLGLDTSTMAKNEVYTLRVSAMPEGGTKDDAVWQELRLSLRNSEPTPEPEIEPTEVPEEDPTEEPTEEPTEAPTEEPTAEPTEEPTAEPTEEPVAEVEDFSISVDGAEVEDGIVLIEEGKYTVRWGAESGVESYYVYLYDGNGELMNKAEDVNNTELGVSADSLKPGAVYTLKVGARPVNGGKDDIVWQEISLMRPLPPTAEPTEEPTPEPTKVPASEIEGFGIGVEGAEVEDGVILIEKGKYTVRWGAESGVESYYVYLYDGNGDLMNKAEDVSNTELGVAADNLKPGAVYTLKVGAKPVNGGKDDIIWEEIYLMRPVPPTPEPTEEPTPSPVPTEAPTPKPSVGKPVISIGSSAHQKDGVAYISGETIIFNWMAEGQVESYYVYLVYEDGTKFELGMTQNTSKTLSAEQLQPGRYKLYVGAIPVGGDESDMVENELRFVLPEPEPDPTEVPEPDPTEAPEKDPEPDNSTIDYLDGNSSQKDIQKVQMALYGFGLLNEDKATFGVLDIGTLQAVAQFQQMLNEQHGTEIYVIDPEMDAFVDTETLYYLLYAGIDLY